MPRRGEESSSPAPRRSPRAAVKASASPSPIIRGSRSRSTAKQTTTKTRVASPSPKRRTTSKSTKTENETAKQAQGRASAAAKKGADKTKKSPAAAKTAAASKSRSRGRQQKVVEDESEEEEEEEEDEEEEEEVEETKPSARRSRSRTTKAAPKAAPPPPPPAKKGRATSARSRAPAKEESEEEEEEEEEVEEPIKAKTEKKKPPQKQEPEQTDDGGGGRKTSRSRRAASRQSEESAAVKEEVKEVAAKPMRSRSRGQVKKAEDEPCVEVAAEGRTSRARTSGPTEDGEELHPQEGPQSKGTTPTKRGQEQSQKLEEPKDAVADSGSNDVKEEAPKAHKRVGAGVEKSPESIPSSKRRRKDEVAESVPGEDNKKEPILPTEKPTSVTSAVEPKPKETQSEKKGVFSVGMAEAEEPRIETDMEVDEEESAGKISPKTSPMKETSQSVTVTSPICKVIDESKVKAGSLDTSKSPIKSPDSIDLSSSVKAASESIQLSKSPVKSSVDLSKKLPSSADLSEGPVKSVSVDLPKSTTKSPSGMDLPKDLAKDYAVKSPSKANLLQSPAKATGEVNLSAKSPVAADESKVPIKTAVAAEVSKVPIKTAVAAEELKVPIKTAVAAEVAKVPIKTAEVAKVPVEPVVPADVVKSPVKLAVPTDAVKSPVKLAVPTDAVKSPVKPVVPADVVKSPVKPVVPADVVKSPIKLAVPADTVKSPVKPAVPADVVKSPVKPAVPADVVKSPVKPAVPADVVKGPVKPVVPADVVKSPVKPVVPADVVKSAVKPVVPADVVKSPVKPVVPADVVKSPVKPVVPADVVKSPVKPAVPADVVKGPVKPVVPADVVKSPIKPAVPADVVKSPVKPAVPADVVKSPVKPVVPADVVKSPVKPVVPADVVKNPVKPAVPADVVKSPVKPAVPADVVKSPVKPVVPADVVKSPIKPAVPADVLKTPVKLSVPTDVLKSPVKSPEAMDVSASPIKSPLAMDALKGSMKSPLITDVSKSPMKSPIVMDISEIPVKSPVAMDATKGPVVTGASKSTMSPLAMDMSKSPVDLTKCSKPIPEIVESPVKSVLSTTISSSTVKASNVPTVTTTPLPVPTSTVKPVPSSESLPQKDKLPSAPHTKFPLAGSQSSNTDTPISPVSGMSAQSPLLSVASATSPVCQPIGSPPVKSFTPQTAAGLSPVIQGSSSKPTISSPKSPLPVSRSPVISGIGVSPSKPSCQPGGGVSTSALQSASQSSTRQPLVQSITRSPDVTLSPTRHPLGQSSNHSPVAPSSNLSPARQPVESSANLAKVNSPTKQPVVQCVNKSQSTAAQGTNLSSVKSSVPSPHHSLVKPPATSLTTLSKPTTDVTGFTSSAKLVSPQSPRIVQNKPDSSTSGCLGLTSEPGSQQSKPLFAPTGQMSPMKTSVSPIAVSPQSKPSISPTKPAGYSEKPTHTTNPSKSAISSISSTSSPKPTVTNESGIQPAAAAVSISSGSPTKQVVQPPSVPIGQSGTPCPVSPKPQETKISSSHSATIKPPQVTHVAAAAGGGAAASKPLITHMSGVVPQKSSGAQSAVTMPIKTSSVSPDKSRLALGFSISPSKPSAGQGCSTPASPVVSKPSIIPSTGNTSPKSQPHPESIGISSKPPQTWGTMSSPPKPQVTHLAGVVAPSRPQVSHMSGVAPPKSQISPSDASSHPKPPVVHVTGSAVQKSTGFSPSVAVSPPKTSSSLHSSASFHSTTPASSSTADGSSSTSQSQTKSLSVPVTGKPISPSLGGVQTVSPQKCSSGATTISGQHQATTQPDLSSTASSQQMTSSSIQSSQSLHSQKANVSPTKSPGTLLHKSMQPSSTAGPQLVDSKAQSSCNVSKAPADSSLSSSSTPSAKSLFTTVSKAPMESQSKVPTLSKPNPEATIPVTSSIATVASNKPVSSSSSTTTSGSAHVPIKPALTGQIQTSRPPSVQPALVTVGNVQQIGTRPIPGASPPQLADSSKASSSSEGVINGAGAKTSAGMQVQSSEANKKRKWDSEQPEESHEAKKSRVTSEDAKSLIANGQKDSSSIQASKLLPPSQSPNKPEVMDVDPSPSVKQDSNGSEVSLKDYVVVNKNEVPHKDSSEVRDSLPKMPLSNPTPTQYASVGSTKTSGSSSTTSGSSSSSSSGSSGQSTGFKDVLLNRAFNLNPVLQPSTITEKSKQFSVVTYNILADCHFRRNDKLDRYPTDEKPFIQLPARHKRLMAELRYVDADIVCLQEVEPEYYSKTLSPDMQRLGYEGFYKKRVHENYDEGETTFYKTSRFSDPENTAYSLKQLIDKDIQELSLSEDIKESVRKFMCRPDVLLVTRLRCKNTGKFITVGNVHVNWGEFRLPNLQCVQIARAIREVVNRAGSDSSPHVICGDFNSFPRAPGYQLASEGYLSDSMIHSLQSSKTMEMPDGTKSALIDHLWQGFQHTSSSLKSAYCVVQGREPELTSMTTHTRECLDYVFYSSSSLEAVGVLKVPEKQIVLDCNIIPNRIFPSDHLSLKAVLAFK